MHICIHQDPDRRRRDSLEHEYDSSTTSQYPRRRRRSYDQHDYDQYDDQHPYDYDHRDRDRDRDYRLDSTRDNSSRWPPVFARDGAAYTLDPNSGYFYDPVSNFYYEPKSKLYYSNLERVYYRHEVNVRDNCGFVRIDNTVNANAQDKTQVLQNPCEDAMKKVDEKKIVIGEIKLKTAASVPLPQARTSSNSNVKKKVTKHKGDIEKWAERQSIEKGSSNAGASCHSQQTFATSTGQPVCLLCRRKFGSIEQLCTHVSQSKLHKHNLKQAKTNEQYQDRARQRRSMYEITNANKSSSSSNRDALVEEQILSQGPSLEKARTVINTDVVRHEDALSVGQQLLQKMGWKHGEKLGVTRSSETQSEDMTVKLKQDWAAIETLASSQNLRRKI